MQVVERPDVKTLIHNLRVSLQRQQDADAILQQLCAAQIRDIDAILQIEQAITDAQHYMYPSPSTAGTSMSKLWDGLVRALPSVSRKSHALSIRFEQAIFDNRIGDAQQSLVQLKSLHNNDRIYYMAHLALTQMLSTTPDDIHARLAASLARKAHLEKFELDPALDVRVVGQIFALQQSKPDLLSIRDTSMAQSKQVHDFLQTDLLKRRTFVSVDAPVASTICTDSTATTSRGQLPTETDLADMDSIALEALSTDVALHLTAHRQPTTVHESRLRTDRGYLLLSILARIFDLTRNPAHLLRLAYYGEVLLQGCNGYEAKQILTHVYSRLGLGTLAIQHFMSLDIKEIQFESAGHALFYDVALMHPFPLEKGRGPSFDPRKQSAHALAIFERHERKLAQCQVDVLQHGQTGILLEIQEMRDCIRTSATRLMYLLQHRRISRLLGVGISEEASPDNQRFRSPDAWIHVQDTRKYGAGLDNGINVERTVQEHSTVDLKRRLLFDLALDSTWSLATRNKPLVDDHERLLAEIQGFKTEQASSSQMTHNIEVFSQVACAALRASAYAACSQKQAASTCWRELITAMRVLLSDERGRASVNTIFLGDVKSFYLQVDLWRIITTLYGKHSKVVFEMNPDDATDLSDILDQFKSLIAGQLQVCQRHVAASEVKALVVSVSPCLASDPDTSFHEFCQRVADSVRLGLDRIQSLMFLTT